MSTILKALRRLEEEKSRGGSQRPLREEVASGPGEQQSRRWTLLFPVLALLIGAGVGASAWYLWPYERILGGGEDVAASAPGTTPEPAALPAPVAAAPAQVAPTPDPVAANDPSQLILPEQQAAPQDASELAAALRDPGMPDDAFASDVQVVDRPQPTPRIEPAPPAPAAPVAPAPALAQQQAAPSAPVPGAERPHPMPSDERSTPRTQLARAETKPAPPKPALQAPARVTPVEQPAEPASKFDPESDFDDSNAEHAAPPPKQTASAPVPVVPGPVVPVAGAPAAEIHVTRTQWHPERARRSAEVRFEGESRSVHEGDTVAGYQVSEIRPSGVVLTRDGERIEQKIGKPPAR